MRGVWAAAASASNVNALGIRPIQRRPARNEVDGPRPTLIRSARNVSVGDKKRKLALGWARANPEKREECRKKWRDAHIGADKVRIRKWREENRGRSNAITAKRRSTKLKATPDWLTQEQRDAMADLYEQAVLAEQLTGVPHHVDHIEPFRGKDRCGLHVPWNLQILTAQENNQKYNHTT